VKPVPDQAVHAQNKALVATFRAAMYDWTSDGVQDALASVFVSDAKVQVAFPFEDLEGPTGWYGEALAPLANAWPDIERRDTIVAAGRTEQGDDWVGCCGYYTGTFVNPWLGITPTHRQAAMRFHEYFRIAGGQIVAMQAIWDIPEVMMQSGLWPMAPSLGREWQVPSPASQDGLSRAERDPDRSAVSLAIVQAMGADMSRHPTEPADAMNIEKYWHPKFSWYGPAGIGTARGIDGFRSVHQIPFLNALPDRRGGSETGGAHFWADGDYVAVTGWPDMAMTVTGDGWLGIVPANTPITMRSLDFWRVEGELIRENWVLIDLLHVWHQLGVDVLARMHELAPRGR